MLGPMLVSMHNLTYYQRLVAEARRAIAEDRFGEPGRGASPRLGARSGLSLDGDVLSG